MNKQKQKRPQSARPAPRKAPKPKMVVQVRAVPKARPQKHPKPKYTAPRAVHIPGRELVMPIVGSTSYSVSAYEVNIGNASIFPRISHMAGMYVKYRFKHLTFNYVPTTGANTTNSVLGTVRLGMNGNPLADEFATDIEFANFREARTTTPNSPISLRVPQEMLNKWRYISVQSVASLPDHAAAADYFIGKFNVGVNGNYAEMNLGQLYVSYDVEFDEPRMPPGTGYESEMLIVRGEATYSGTVTGAFRTDIGTVIDDRSTLDEGEDYRWEGPNTNPVLIITKPGLYKAHYMINGTFANMTSTGFSGNGNFDMDPTFTVSGTSFRPLNFGYGGSTGGQATSFIHVPEHPSGNIFVSIGSPTTSTLVKWVLIIVGVRDLVGSILPQARSPDNGETFGSAAATPAPAKSDYVVVQSSRRL